MTKFNQLNLEAERERERERVNSSFASPKLSAKVGRKFFNSYFVKTAAILFCVGFLFFAHGASAATYYVGLTGNDSYTSTQAQASTTPWKTIEHAIEDGGMNFGDTLILETGTYAATNIWKSGSNYQIRSSYMIITGTGAVTIQAEAGGLVTIDLPTNTLVAGLFVLQGSFVFENINFTNSSSTAAGLLNIGDQNQSATDITFQNCTFDWGNASTSYVINVGTITNYDAHVSVVGCKIKNVKSTGEFLRNIIDPTNKVKVAYFNVTSSLFRNSGEVLLSGSASNGPTNLTFINNTVANLTSWTVFDNFASTSVAKIENNIFRLDATTTHAIYTPNFFADSSKWTVKNNIFYRTVTTDPGSQLDNVNYGSTTIFPLDESNFYLDPEFTDEVGDDYSMTSTSYANGRGSAIDLPATDINGNSWSGSHIGAYPNTNLTPAFPTLQSGKVAYVGDSIAEGSGNNMSSDGRFLVVGSGVLGAAIGGSSVTSLPYLIDRAATTWKPNTIFIISANNNFTGGGNNPSAITYNQAINVIQVAMKKAQYWGITPIWLGMGGQAGTSSPSTVPTLVNNSVQDMCITNGYSCGSFLNFFMTLKPTTWNLATSSGGFYLTGGVNMNVHPDTPGYNIISNLAEYLYYNKSTIGSTKLDIGAGARIYADGQFRDLGIANSNLATLSITPQGGVGNFNANDKSAYLDITDLTNWTATHKTWTESNAQASDMVTDHTVGDLDSNKYYAITISDLINPSSAYVTGINGTTCTTSGTVACQADSSGTISFEYNGGYSTHTFDMSELSSANAITTFSFDGLTPAVTGTISGTNVALTVPYNANVTALVATFTTTGSSVAFDAITQTSGTTPNDFTSPVTYRVTAEDNSTQDYIVTVTVTATPACSTVANAATYNAYPTCGVATCASGYTLSNGTCVASGGGGGGSYYYTISVNSGMNGFVSPPGSSSFISGSSQTFTITPYTGYQIADVLVDGSSVGSVNTYTFNNITTNHIISATFLIIPITSPTPVITPISAQPLQNTMTTQQKVALIAQIKQQLIVIINQLIQMLMAEVSAMGR